MPSLAGRQTKVRICWGHLFVILVGTILTITFGSRISDAYEYGGKAWCDCEDIVYFLNPAELSLQCATTGTFFGSVTAAAETWNAQPGVFTLAYGGITNTEPVSDSLGFCLFARDSVNVIAVGRQCSLPPGVLAWALSWSTNGCIFEADMQFSNSHEWYEAANTGSCSGTCYDVESVALHEFGHWINLGHEPHDASLGYRPVMYPNVESCEMRRTLTADDIRGFEYVYDPDTNLVIGLPDRDRPQR